MIVGITRAAARAFAEADAALPSPAALTAALDDAVLADDPILGGDLLERARARNVAADAARTKLGGRAGRVRITCPDGSTCSMLVDERTSSSELWVGLGPHQVTTRIDATMREQSVDVHGRRDGDLDPRKAASRAHAGASSAAHRRRCGAASEEAPWALALVVYIGGGLTLAFAGGTIATGILAKNEHDQFVDKHCDKGPGPDCHTIRDRGLPLLIGTNVLLGFGIVSLVATSVLAIGFTDWHASVAPAPGGAITGIGRRF